MARKKPKFTEYLLPGDRVKYDTPTGFGTGVVVERRRSDHVRVGGESWPEYVVQPDRKDSKPRVIQQYQITRIENPRKTRNPNPTTEDANKLFEQFHGRPSSGTIEIAEKEKYYSKLAILGELEELGILEPNGKKVTPIRFKPNKLIGSSIGDDTRCVWVAAANKHQIEFVDGDQALDFNEEICRRLDIDPDELEKQMVEVGQVRSIVYFTDKHHLEGPRYQEKGTSYEHKFAEEGGKMPVLFYDTLNDTIMLVGGSYTVESEGIKN